MRFFAQRRTTWLVAALIAGVLLCWGGYKLATWQAPQVAYYNLALQAYQAGDMPKAIQFFDRSIAAYKREQNATWLHRFIYPRPSKDYAAKAYFHKAKAHLQNRQAELAVAAFEDSLRLNPGDQLKGLLGDEALQLREDALVVKYDFELLLTARKDLAEGQGKGKGKGNRPGQGQGEGEGEQPGQQPGSKPGKGRPDDI